jgi:hypothetical protein
MPCLRYTLRFLILFLLEPRRGPLQQRGGILPWLSALALAVVVVDRALAACCITIAAAVVAVAVAVRPLAWVDSFMILIRMAYWVLKQAHLDLVATLQLLAARGVKATSLQAPLPLCLPLVALAVRMENLGAYIQPMVLAVFHTVERVAGTLASPSRLPPLLAPHLPERCS